MSDQNEMAPQPPVGFDEMLRDALLGEHPDYHIPFELTLRVKPELDLAPYEVKRPPTVWVRKELWDLTKSRVAELERKLELSDRACRAAEEVMMDAQLCTPDERAVLNAMAAVPRDTLERSLKNELHSSEHSRDPARAELARRAAAEKEVPDQNTRAQVVEAMELFAALTPNERDVVTFLADDEHLDLAALSTILEAIAPLDENYRGELTEYADDSEPIGRCDLCGKKAPLAVTDRGAICSWGCDEL
jgi:hypothetical protein